MLVVLKRRKYAISELFTLAAEQGLAKAQFNLGAIYANGDVVERSISSAHEWFTKAAAQGDKKAIEQLKRLDEHLRCW